MAAKEYSSWNALGRPHTPAQPVRDIVTKLKAAFPQGKYFNWEANEAHYTANPPQDHTPFSYDGWPLPSPHWVVFATDIMASDVGGTAGAQRLFDYYLREARAGRLAWLKYLIWQAKIYDVRHGWVPQPSSGHFDHIHISVRTDAEHLSLGNWSVTPVEESMFTPEQEAFILRKLGYIADFQDTHFMALIWNVNALLNNLDKVADGPTKGAINQLKVALAALKPQPVTAEQLEQIKAAAGAGGAAALDGVVATTTISKP